MIFSMLPPSRSVRPQLPQKSVSPENRTLSVSAKKQMLPCECPGVVITFNIVLPNVISAPSPRDVPNGGSGGWGMLTPTTERI